MVEKVRDPRYDYFFMGGLPRSGSTLLSVILNQNPNLFVSKVSALPHLLYQTNIVLNNLIETYDFNFDSISMIVNEFLTDIYYKHIKKRYIIDKSRAWNANLYPLKYFLNPDVKVLCPYRPVPDIIVSFLKLMEQDPDNYLLKDCDIDDSLEVKSKILWEHHLKEDVINLKKSLEKYPENLMLIEYDTLVKEPENTIVNIYDFLEIPIYDHKFNNLFNNRISYDGNEGNFFIKNLHVVRSNIEKTSENPEFYLGKELFSYFSEFNINTNYSR